MNQNFKVILGLSLILIGCTLCFAVIQYFENARESEVKTQLEAIVAAQQSYYSKFEKYIDDDQRLGFSPEAGSERQIFLSIEKLPAEFKAILPKSALPFVSKDSFRILYVIKTGGNLQFFTLDEKKVYQKMSFTVVVKQRL